MLLANANVLQMKNDITAEYGQDMLQFKPQVLTTFYIQTGQAMCQNPNF